jgi:hypothetical protein
MEISEVLPYLVSAATGIAGVFGGLRLKKANEKKAEAEAKSVEIDNEEKVVRMQLEYIVKPLEAKVDRLTKETRKLRSAINRIADCSHEANCPVRHDLQKKDEEYEK